MSASFLSPEEWLVRSSLAGGVLLLVGAVLMILTPQPARRQRIGELALLCGLLVAGLCALPAWTPWSLPLWNEPPAERTEPAAFFVDADTAPAPTAGEEALLRLERSYVLEANITQASELPLGELAPAGAESPTIWVSSLPWLVTAYIVMTCFLIIRCLLGHIGLRRMWGSAVPPPRHVTHILSQLTLGWRRVPRIGVSPRVPLPVSFGLWRPTILIPVSFCHLGRQDDLRQVLVHELTHLKRLDSWSCLLVALGQSLYFHLPWFWWLRKQVRLCQEYVADAAAASLTSSEDYAEYLVSLSGCAAPRLPVGAYVMGVKDKNSDLFRRVTMLLNSSHSVENRPPHWWTVLTAGAFFAVAVLVSGIGLRATARADDPKTEKKITLQVVEDSNDAEIVIVSLDPTDKNKVIVHSPNKGSVKWIQELLPYTGGKAEKQIVWATDAGADGKFFVAAQGDPKTEYRWTVNAGDGKDDKKVIVVGPDGSVKGQNIQVIEAKDGKRIIIIVDTSASVEEGKKSADKKAPIRQIIERKIELAKPKGDDVEKRKQMYEEAFRKSTEALKKAPDSDTVRKALEAAKEKAKSADVLIEKQAIEDVIKSIEKHVSKEEAEQVKKALESYRKALEHKGSTDKLKQLGDVYKRVEVDQQKIEEAVRKAQAAAAMKAKEAAGGGAAKAQEAEAKANEVEANVRFRAAKALTEAAKGAGAKSGGGKLGVSIGSPSESLMAQLDLPKGQGIVIESVLSDSPAAKAGFQPHDVLVEFNGKPVSSEPEALVKAIAEMKAGAKIDAVVLRKGKKTTVKGIVLADAKSEFFKYEQLKEGKPVEYKFELKQVKPLEKIELEKLKGQLKELDNLKLQLPKQDLEKLHLELKQAPKIEIKNLKQDDLKKSIQLSIPKGEIKVLELEHPTIKAGEKLHILKDVTIDKTPAILKGHTIAKTPVVLEAFKADGKRVTITMNRDNDKFTGKYDEGSLSISVTGMVKDGKVAVDAITVKENDKEDKYSALEKAPAKLRERVKRLIELAEKGKVDFKVDD